MTSSGLRGTGTGILPAATRGGQRNLLTPGARPEVSPAWSTFAPTAVTLPDGRTVTETSFTRLTGRSPILLAGMTPTTVDAAIVAAAANAGHWAELAGGGQVTEQIFADRVAELRTLLEPGREVQFNSLFLDPYLWKLQLGGKRLVQRARAAGAPFDGVVVTAGIPELEEAVALIEELAEANISYVAFKPGTIAQIRSVIRIANEVPDYQVIVHIEGGRAGGHHSWEDLDDLLLGTYAELRTRPNVIVCVGGGIGTPERAAEYLTGTWSLAYGFPEMPLDGILVGTAAMATLEATTAPEVKQLLVDTPGTPDWVGAGTAVGGMASGRSQLGADIHEIDNTASRCGRLLDDVAGDADAVAARRDEIIEALNGTAKPYFGDVETMTYTQWLQRYVEVSIGGGESTAAGESLWLDITWRDRFASMLQRAEARLNPADRGEVPTLFADEALLEDPTAAIATLRETYPGADTALLHPADVPFFIAQCRTPGKPVNFVPVVDKDVRRWWRSDSLWQAHDPRYSADQVCVIPGTVAVAGITRVDEPVGELLDRFEKATTDALLAAGATAASVSSRRRAAVAAGPVDIVLAAPDVTWAGRLTKNPVARLGAFTEWTVDGTTASHAGSGATLTQLADATDAAVELVVPLLGDRRRKDQDQRPGFDPHRWCAGRHRGGRRRVDVGAARRRRRAGTARGEERCRADQPGLGPRPGRRPRRCHGRRYARHPQLGRQLRARRARRCLLAGGVRRARRHQTTGASADPATDGNSVIEGMLDLVHLDHQVQLLKPLPTETSVLSVKAEAGEVLDTDLGRVVEVTVTIGSMRDQGIEAPTFATLVERFAIRGRTGTGELTDPPRAGGSVSADAVDTPRRRRRDVTIVAPTNMGAFAQVSGDHNPIHTSNGAALLAGLGTPIVHGMWLSAAAQHAVVAVDPESKTASAKLTAWTARFLGMVRPGASIDLQVNRVGDRRRRRDRRGRLPRRR